MFPIIDGEIDFSDKYCYRYSSMVSAHIGHRRVVELVKDATNVGSSLQDNNRRHLAQQELGWLEDD